MPDEDLVLIEDLKSWIADRVENSELMLKQWEKLGAKARKKHSWTRIRAEQRIKVCEEFLEFLEGGPDVGYRRQAILLMRDLRTYAGALRPGSRGPFLRAHLMLKEALT